MARLLVGLPALQGDLEKYASRFEVVELRLDGGGAGKPPGAAPKPATLRKWRKAVPPSFVFSVVLPREVGALTPGPALDAALASSLEAAAALEARCVLLQTPPEVRPTAGNKRRLAALFERIPREGTIRCWEPLGLWEREEAIAAARTLGVVPVLDVAHEVPGPGPILYTRLRALGKSAALGAAAVERVAERLRKRREAFVIVEGPAGEAQRIKAALAAALAKKPSRALGITVVRPATSTLVAEDEEQ
jgi:uncharacterized protein YecE (DUF72 family)